MFALLFMLLASMVAAICASASLTRIRQARRQEHMEQAFYLAEAGAERAASEVANGQHQTTTIIEGELGAGAYKTLIDVRHVGGDTLIDLVSTGTVSGVSRGVAMRGVRQSTWARWACWYKEENGTLWIIGSEVFNGPVYSEPKLHFHSKGTDKGQAHFLDDAATAKDSIEKENDDVNPKFDKGLRLNVAAEPITAIDFGELKGKSDMVLRGPTTIKVSGDRMTVTNTREGYSNKEMDIPADGVIYVQAATDGRPYTRAGTVTLSAPDGVDGRLTVVADNDIKITGHVRCEDNPETNPNSNDAVGLIAKGNVEVQTSAPDNLEIFAHIICQEGGFGVAEHNTGDYRGTLKVYGGLVMYWRHPVGTFNANHQTGYTKNYVFDPRFTKNPPPCYPKLSDELEWTQWEG
ncbi:MAG: hypothetical protein PHR35_00745 [Kiritimatiellae bacterium]|nr:hypothetical protein [Kiritimatiellia bacterium]